MLCYRGVVSSPRLTNLLECIPLPGVVPGFPPVPFYILPVEGVFSFSALVRRSPLSRLFESLGAL